MKKLLGIVVLGLLLSSNANAEFSKGTNMLKIAENMSPTYDYYYFKGITSGYYLMLWRANKRYLYWSKGFNNASFNQKFYFG